MSIVGWHTCLQSLVVVRARNASTMQCVNVRHVVSVAVNDPDNPPLYRLETVSLCFCEWVIYQHLCNLSTKQSNPQVMLRHQPSGTLPLLFTRSAVTFPDTGPHCPRAGTTLYCRLAEAHSRVWITCPRLLCKIKPMISWSQIRCSADCATMPPCITYCNNVWSTNLHAILIFKRFKLL